MEQNADGSANAPEAGGESLGWRAQLPDDLKTHEAFTAYKTVGELAKTHLDVAGKNKEFEGKLANSIPKLSEKSTEEERAAYFKAIGRPDKPEEYDLKIPDGVSADPKFVEGFKAMAFEQGLTKAQVDSLASWYLKDQQTGSANLEKAIKERQEKAVNELKDEWGAQYESKLDAANKAVARIVDDETYEYMKGYGLTNDSRMVKFFHKLSEIISEDAFIPPKGTPPRQREKSAGGQPILEFPSMDKK